MGGALGAMVRHNFTYVATQTAMRYRKEIPIGQCFEIHSSLKAFDDRHMWIQQTFRGGAGDNNGNHDDEDLTEENNTIEAKEEGKGRILAQMLLEAAVLQNGKLVHPRLMLEAMDVPEIIA